MQVGNFNRHECMDAATRELVMNCIETIRYKAGGNFTLENYLYGLFDGFDYSKDIMQMEFVQELKNSNPELYQKLEGLCDTVSKYPKGKTSV